MRPSRLYLFASFCFFRVLIFAQSYTLTLEDKQLKIKNFPYYVVQVTDARAQTYCLGMAKTGMAGHRVPVFSKDSLTTEISGLFRRSLGPDTAGHTPLVLRINQLLVYEDMLNAGQAFLEISLSFLQPVAGGYIELTTIGATSTKISQIDASRKHDDNIVAGIEDCLATFWQEKQMGNLGTRRVPAAHLYQLPDVQSFAVLQNGSNKAGVFHSFSDFLNNTPNEHPGLPIVMKPGRVRGKGAVYYQLEKGNDLDEKINVWGVSDGQYAYALIYGDYYRIERSGDSLLVNLPAPVSADDATPIFIIGGLGLIGGLAGLAVSGIIAAATKKDVPPPVPYQVDLLTSSLSPVNLPNTRRVEARVLLCCSEFARSPITVRLDGQELCTLEKGQFYRLRVPPPAAEINLTLEANGKTYQEKVQPEMFNTEVCLLRIVKGEPRLDTPNGEIRSKLLRQISDGEVKEQCRH